MTYKSVISIQKSIFILASWAQTAKSTVYILIKSHYTGKANIQTLLLLNNSLVGKNYMEKKTSYSSYITVNYFW